MFGLIPAVIISFEASWELSFVMLLGVPAVALFNVFQIKLLRGRSHKNKKRLEESGQLAVESINNMRTVASLGLERTLCDKYNNLLKGPFRYVVYAHANNNIVPIKLCVTKLAVL